MSNPKQSFLIADLIWWLRGYTAAYGEELCYITKEHISALINAKTLTEKEEDLREEPKVYGKS
jgi:hypothetical protein